MTVIDDFEGDMMDEHPGDIAAVNALKEQIAQLQNRNRAHFHSALQYAEQGGCGFGSEINSREGLRSPEVLLAHHLKPIRHRPDTRPCGVRIRHHIRQRRRRPRQHDSSRSGTVR